MLDKERIGELEAKLKPTVLTQGQTRIVQAYAKKAKIEPSEVIQRILDKKCTIGDIMGGILGMKVPYMN